MGSVCILCNIGLGVTSLCLVVSLVNPGNGIVLLVGITLYFRGSLGSYTYGVTLIVDDFLLGLGGCGSSNG